MKDPATMLEALGQPFPANAVEKRKGGGGRMYDYVAAETVIRRLNSATNGEWSFVITGHEWRGDVLITWGELSIPGLGTRSGTGVQTVAANAGEDIIKGSASDCLKKCATQFGVALELYGPDLEAGEVARAQQRPAQRPQSPLNAPKQSNAGTDKGPMHSPGMRRIHAIGNKYGFTHEELRILCDREEYAANKQHIASMNDAPEPLLTYVASLIEKNPTNQRKWLDQRAKQQAELMPGMDAIPNPRTADSFTNN